MTLRTKLDGMETMDILSEVFARAAGLLSAFLPFVPSAAEGLEPIFAIRPPRRVFPLLFPSTHAATRRTRRYDRQILVPIVRQPNFPLVDESQNRYSVQLTPRSTCAAPEEKGKVKAKKKNGMRVPTWDSTPPPQELPAATPPWVPTEIHRARNPAMMSQSNAGKQLALFLIRPSVAQGEVGYPWPLYPLR